ncbi:MAG: flagellar motor protein MotB [Leifsonia sp.]
MSRRRRRALDTGGEFHADERWMASYTDMVTVLMCLFIVLFAMSTVDQAKFTALKNSLATGFGVVDEGKVDTASGVVVPAEQVEHDAEGFVGPAEVAEPTDLEKAEVEVDALTHLRDQLYAALDARGLASDVTFTIDQRGLTIGLIGWETFFQPNSDALGGPAISVLDTIGPILTPTPYEVSVEGHADFRGTSFPFPTDWELSSGRATQVLRRLVEVGGIPGGRISSVGYGSARPAATGPTESDAAQNRRVDIAVLSTMPDDVRAKIPEVLASR